MANKPYIKVANDQISVAVPLSINDHNWVCSPLSEIPRLFLGFPLVGTDSFSFPGVINSFQFTPTEHRDGVPLARGTDPANLNNETVLADACFLLVELIKHAAESGWHNVYELAYIPEIRERDWLNVDWFRETLTDKLIEIVRQTEAVINECGLPRKPEEASLPLAEIDAKAPMLWDLLNAWKENGQNLPRRRESAGWCRAIKSWARLTGCCASTFNEGWDGPKLN